MQLAVHCEAVGKRRKQSLETKYNVKQKNKYYIEIKNII